MLRQASCSGTVPGHHGMWSSQELDEEWLACATGAAGEEWPEWPSAPSGSFGAGAGFAAGGLLDRLTPGPALAGFAQNAWADGLGTLSDDALVGVLQAWRRLASWAAAGELAAVAELDRRRWAEVAAGADPHLAEHVGDELAAALTLTTRSADALLDVACNLARLPLTRAALATGQIDRARALVISDGVSCLSDAHAAAVESAVIGRAPGQTSGQLRAATQRAVLAVDPAAATRRREEARKDARVEVWDERCGTAALAGRDLPPADVLAADKRIDALARQLKSAGQEESLSALRAQVYLALLRGQPIAGFAPAVPSGPGTTEAGSRNDQDASAAPGPDGDGSGAFPARPGGQPGPPLRASARSRRRPACSRAGICRARAGRFGQPDHAAGYLAGRIIGARRGCRIRPSSRRRCAGPRGSHCPPARGALVPDSDRPGRARCGPRMRPGRAARGGPGRPAARGARGQAGVAWRDGRPYRPVPGHMMAGR